MNKVKHFSKNQKNGRDFIVGDIHGCHAELLSLLSFVNFDVTKDRLFSTGDLIDRGKDSLLCLSLIMKPWFFCVRGNHEQILLEVLSGVREKAPNDLNWIHEDDTLSKIKRYLPYLENLPYIITVGEHEDRFNIVHAELWEKDIFITDKIIDNYSFKNEKIDYMLLWSRSLFKLMQQKFKNTINHFHDEEKMSITYCGHNIVDKPCRFEQMIYIDTGAFLYNLPNITEEIKNSNNYGLTILEHNTGKFWMYHTTGSLKNKITEIKF